MSDSHRFHHRPHRVVAGFALTAVLGLGAGACSGGSTTAVSSTAPMTAVGSAASPGIDSPGTAQDDAAPAAGTLDAAEVAALLHMVDEEKLALDVYTMLGATWDLPTFTNIPRAEATHVETVRTLLDNYGVTDPTGGLASGQYADPAFESLYVELVARGQSSEIEALKVGSLIEELDITDLQDRIAQTDEAAIVTAFESLERGSRNHLRAFTNALSSRGGSYTPVYLSVVEYQAIISGAAERGGGNGR